MFSISNIFQDCLQRTLPKLVMKPMKVLQFPTEVILAGVELGTLPCVTISNVVDYKIRFEKTLTLSSGFFYAKKPLFLIGLMRKYKYQNLIFKIYFPLFF